MFTDRALLNIVHEKKKVSEFSKFTKNIKDHLSTT